MQQFSRIELKGDFVLKNSNGIILLTRNSSIFSVVFQIYQIKKIPDENT